jgi:hypothetical protein
VVEKLWVWVWGLRRGQQCNELGPLNGILVLVWKRILLVVMEALEALEEGEEGEEEVPLLQLEGVAAIRVEAEAPAMPGVAVRKIGLGVEALESK